MNTDKDHIVALLIAFMLVTMVVVAFLSHALGFSQGQIYILLQEQAK